MCPDNQLNQWALLKLSSCLSHFLSDENKEQNSFFVPESETSAPDYWRESSGTNNRFCCRGCRAAADGKQRLNEDNFKMAG